MEIKIRRVYRKISLSDYFGDGEDYLEAWVNPTVGLLEKWDNIKSDINEDESLVDWFLDNAHWFAQILRKENKHPDPEELQEVIASSFNEDPAFWPWIMAEIWRLINEHRFRLGKG